MGEGGGAALFPLWAKISIVRPGRTLQFNGKKLVAVNALTLKMKETKEVSPCELVVAWEEVGG